MGTDLLPCPFCGEPAGTVGNLACCYNEHCAIYRWQLFKDHWNRRSLEQRAGWIAVGERLPERFEPVLVACKDQMIGMSQVRFVPKSLVTWNGQWSLGGTCVAHDAEITHWMPLPRPPAAQDVAGQNVAPQDVSARKDEKGTTPADSRELDTVESAASPVAHPASAAPDVTQSDGMPSEPPVFEITSYGFMHRKETYDALRAYASSLAEQVERERHQRQEDDAHYKADIEHQEQQLDAIAKELGLPLEARGLAGCDVLAHYVRDTVINGRDATQRALDAGWELSVMKQRAESAEQRANELHANGERLKEAADGWKAEAERLRGIESALFNAEHQSAKMAAALREVDETLTALVPDWWYAKWREKHSAIIAQARGEK